MNEKQIPFSIPNVTARKLIESFQLLQLVPSPAYGGSRNLSVNVACKQKDGRSAVVVTIKLGYSGAEDFDYIYEGQFVNDVAVSQLGMYNGSDRNFHCGDIGLFNEAVVTETV